jgi:prepilin-type N-terminal cleavage/methylation domain-containing protein
MKKRGFTLVELLVVISIIALLLAILMPSLNAAKQQASAVVCLFNVRTLSTAWHMYAGENRDKIVGAHTQLSGPDTVSGRKYAGYFTADRMKAVYSDSLANFVTDWVEWPQKEDGTFYLNAPPKKYEILGIQRGLLFSYTGKKVEVYHCPSDKRLKWDNRGQECGGYRSYSIAGSMDGYYVGTRVIKKHSQIPQPSQKYVFVEEYWVDPARGWNYDGWQLNPAGDKWIDPVSAAHRSKSILGFADGHGEAIKWKDKRTVLFSNDHGNNPPQPDNLDLKYMQQGWAVPK